MESQTAQLKLTPLYAGTPFLLFKMFAFTPPGDRNATAQILAVRQIQIEWGRVHVESVKVLEPPDERPAPGLVIAHFVACAESTKDDPLRLQEWKRLLATPIDQAVLVPVLWGAAMPTATENLLTT